MTVLKFAFRRWLYLGSIIILATLLMNSEAGNTRSKKFIRLGFPVGITEGNSTNIDATIHLSTFVEIVKYLNHICNPLNVEILFSYFDSGTPSFTSGVQSGLYLTNRTLFNSGQIHGVIGGGSNSVTLALAQILAEVDIAQISYASDSFALSHASFGETHSRVSPTSSEEVVTMADMIHNTFGWKRVAVIYSTDKDGMIL